MLKVEIRYTNFKFIIFFLKLTTLPPGGRLTECQLLEKTAYSDESSRRFLLFISWEIAQNRSCRFVVHEVGIGGKSGAAVCRLDKFKKSIDVLVLVLALKVSEELIGEELFSENEYRRRGSEGEN